MPQELQIFHWKVLAVVPFVNMPLILGMKKLSWRFSESDVKSEFLRKGGTLICLVVRTDFNLFPSIPKQSLASWISENDGTKSIYKRKSDQLTQKLRLLPWPIIPRFSSNKLQIVEKRCKFDTWFLYENSQKHKRTENSIFLLQCYTTYARIFWVYTSIKQ